MSRLREDLGLITFMAIVLAICGPEGWAIPGVRGQLQPDGRQRGRPVPALYIFGDSTADSGNNNEMFTIARANFPPYGRDFDTRHATGRFSNGRMTSDFITDFLRVPMVPPYVSLEAQMYSFQGANFASAGAGILNQTGNILGAKISQWQQIDLFLERRNYLIQMMGNEAAARHLRHAIYYIATGGNDYIHNWITNDTDAALLPHDQFNSLLLATFEQQLKVLYGGGARKVVVLGIGPVGCAPHFLWLSNTTTAACMETVNQYVSEYNDGLRAMLARFNQQNRGAHFVYRDIWDIVYRMSKTPLEFGFLIGTTACCGVGNYGGGDRCLTPLMVCRNPPDYVWWDEYHPSHRANFLIARQIWSGVDPSTTTNTSAAPSNVTYSFLTVQQLVNVQLESD
ncbi:hypothetical protein MPTK1_1g12740 [Marchantia polymorpha subsp. ruderalis]|nr:hypothetical protein MARPO_0019s0044 [Marchantia polymorpha]BBM98340.1 hypothetical protein Mp_1g12740 [Marchantia polymorpha subsp. ruderalis]|eukprot:PTQ44607.1 hypothetical protein MARPO_0019s0044 [Marchantia polymorpha]